MSKGVFVWGQGLCLGGGVSVWSGVSVQGVSIQGGLYPGGGSLSRGKGLCPGGGSLSRGSLSKGVSVQVVSVRGSLSREVSVQGGLCPEVVSVQEVSVREPPDRDPPPIR